jgi:flagellar M-ring protein FliF
MAGGRVNGLIEFVKALGAARLAAMAAVTAALVGFFIAVGMRVTAPTTVPLFTELSMEDSNRVLKELEAQVVPYELRGDGSTVPIPKDQVTRARMRLVEAGLLRGGSVGYEIFDKSDTLGITSFVQNVNHLHALEGELARTIQSLDRVSAGRDLKPERVSIVDEQGRLLAEGVGASESGIAPCSTRTEIIKADRM